MAKDLNKPTEGPGSRSPKTIKIEHGIGDSYKFYKENVNNKLHVDKKTYMAVIKLFLLKFMSKIVYNSDELKLPLALGKLSVKKIKFNPEQELKFTENPNLIGSCLVNWKESRIHKKKIPYVNEHSEYARYKFYWTKKSFVFINKTLYSFKPIRYWKRELARAIIQDKKDYFLS